MIPELVRKVRQLPLQLHGGIGYHRGPVSVNRLGYQVFRAAYKSAAWHLRAAPPTPGYEDSVQALDRDGCITLPNFLPDEVFSKVRAEYDRSRADLPYEVFIVEDNGVVEEQLDVRVHAEHFPTTVAALAESERLLSIVASSLRRPVNPPRLSARHWQRKESPPKPRGFGHVVGANYVHADMHYPTFKAWLYLNDIDESNGAFQFALGSHKMTWSRLAYEYDASVRVARSRTDGSAAELAYAVVREPTERQKARMNLKCTPICGKQNTLVIANTQGFHKQGDFGMGAVREAYHLCFRLSEPG
jgi:hypothetical protein